MIGDTYIINTIRALQDKNEEIGDILETAFHSLPPKDITLVRIMTVETIVDNSSYIIINPAEATIRGILFDYFWDNFPSESDTFSVIDYLIDMKTSLEKLKYAFVANTMVALDLSTPMITYDSFYNIHSIAPFNLNKNSDACSKVFKQINYVLTSIYNIEKYKSIIDKYESDSMLTEDFHSRVKRVSRWRDPETFDIMNKALLRKGY